MQTKLEKQFTNGQLLRLLWPLVIEQALAALVGMIALFGTVHISANAVANNLDNVGCIVGQAMELAMITVVGRCIGAGDPDQAVHYTKKLMLWDYVV